MHDDDAVDQQDNALEATVEQQLFLRTPTVVAQLEMRTGTTRPMRAESRHRSAWGAQTQSSWAAGPRAAGRGS
jgi:hypothetical protein